MCRKWTSSLVAHFIVVTPENLQPDLKTFPHYREYESSPGRYRGFCAQCSSSLIWRSDKLTRTMDLFLGTVDEEWLIGRRDGATGERDPAGAELGRALGIR